MGSLMGGWDSPTSSPRKGGFERNKSLTNGEIETFWKIKHEAQEEHLKAVAEAEAEAEPQGNATSGNTVQVSEVKGALQRKLAANRPVGLDTSRSFPGCNTTSVSADRQFAKMKSKAWWTRSSWAFLNEPPAMEGSTNKYATQYHVSAPGSKQRH